MPVQIDILDALELLCDNTNERTERILRQAIDELERLRTVEIAALSLADELTHQEGPSVTIPTAEHSLIKAIRGL